MLGIKDVLVIQLVVLSLTLYLPCYNGKVVLYVHVNDSETQCPLEVSPLECRLLSEYAMHADLLPPETTFSFLPGVHVLEEVFSINSEMGVTALTLQPTDLGRNTSITCDRGGSFNLTGLQLIDIKLLTFHSCGSPEPGFTPSPVFDVSHVPNVTIQHCILTENSVSILEMVNSTLLFIGNQVTYNLGRWIMLQSSSAATLVDNCFFSNSVSETLGTPGLVVFNSLLKTLGNNVFDSNIVHFSGTLYGLYSVLIFNGNTNFTNNVGGFSGVLTGGSVYVIVAGNIYFGNNEGRISGVMSLFKSCVIFTGEAVYNNNVGNYGGACYLISSNFTFVNEHSASFIANSAGINGGALYLGGGSSLNVLTDSAGSARFQHNNAFGRGGAIFIEDVISLSYCVSGAMRAIAVQECSFRILDYDNTVMYQTRFYFVNNTALVAGNSIFGGVVDSCLLTVVRDTFVVPGPELVNRIISIAGYTMNILEDTNFNTSEISSDPYRLCTCDHEKPNCVKTSIARRIFPGAYFNVTVIALGQRKGAVPAIITALARNITTLEVEQAQGIPGRCSNLTYTIFAEPGNGSLSLMPEVSCLIQDSLQFKVDVEVLECPPGFALEKDQATCKCNPRLLKYTNVCNIQNGTILRDSTFWAGLDGLDGLILYSSCPFDYCIVSSEMNFEVADSNALCIHGRSGVLCGECSEGLTLLLGSSSCEKCSDNYLALLLFFAAAGVILVAFLLLLNLTVAIGTINGLIFYANLVAANKSFVFPSESNAYLDILKVFIAWINLDFGIKSCFYDGMDQYAHTVLQFVFPVYIWALIGLVVLVSRFSSKVANILGNSNPVAVLATLILLSYSKVLQLIIVAFSSANLDLPDDGYRLVWLYDGNVPFLDISDGRHVTLFIISLLLLLLLFVPYTILLSTSQWLQIKSHWKVLSWLNRPQLRAFLDAYHAPYKPRHRYWTGLLLLLRLVILTTSGLTSVDNPNIPFLVVMILVLVVQMWAWINGGIYKNWYLNVIESFFFLNLGLLAVSLQYIHVQFSIEQLSLDDGGTARIATSSTLLTGALAVFIGIIIFHLDLSKNGRRVFNLLATLCKKHTNSKPAVELKPVTKPEAVVVRTTFISLRDSILDA